MKPGDYVVATKYRDGDPHDGWCVGFFTHMHPMSSPETPRFMVDNGKGAQYRANGFRRAQKVSDRRGDWIVKHMPQIEDIARNEIRASPTGRVRRSVWWWVRVPYLKGDAALKAGGEA